ncbi:MAG: transglycosylase SLT domain-containing protein [Cyclobacteriaceae bacterium]
MNNIFIVLSFYLFAACIDNQASKRESNKSDKAEKNEQQVTDIDLKEIKARDTLIAVLNNNSTSYFIYKGQPMGFQYDLLNLIAEDLEVLLKIIVEKDINKAKEMLLNGEVDILAHKLVITPARKEILAFTNRLYTVNKVLVQQKPENWRYMERDQIEKYLIKEPINLIGDTVYVRKSSAEVSALKKLYDNSRGEIIIIEEDGETDTEALINNVALGKIKYTVADDDIARVNKTYYPILNIQTIISDSHEVGWAVRKTSPELLKAINDWLAQIKRKPDFNVIYRKYFVHNRIINNRANSEITTINDGNSISYYDEIIKKYAKQLDWDWKLLAALIYEESRFDYNEVSWMGAVGLMQLIPSTAESFGNYNLYEPWQNIAAGTKYLKWLQNFWEPKVPNEEERLRFILASYNVGQEHVMDAMRLAEKYGRNPYIWADNVEYYLLLKSKPKYYTDPVVKMGYCRGEEPIEYVEEILQVYDRYSQLIKA